MREHDSGTSERARTLPLDEAPPPSSTLNTTEGDLNPHHQPARQDLIHDTTSPAHKYLHPSQPWPP